MNKNYIVLSLSAILLTSACVSDDWQNTASSILNAQMGTSSAASSLTTAQITQGLKEALRVGTTTVTAQLGKSGGFNFDPKIHIPLPSTLTKVDAALTAVGMGRLTDDLETKMNSAAELATVQAKELFLQSIQQMTIADARQILSSQQDAATQYLRRTMGQELAARIQPIVQNTLAQTGTIKAYDSVTSQYAALPFISGLKTDMNNYVTEKAIDGIFYYVAQEEAAIRQNPAKRTTEILRTVFGAN